MAPKLVDSEFVYVEIDLEDTYCAKHLAEHQQSATIVEHQLADELTDGLTDGPTNVNLPVTSVLRAKVLCDSVKLNSSGEETIRFLSVLWDDALSVAPPFQVQPIEMVINDPASQGKFKPGKTYYITFGDL